MIQFSINKEIKDLFPDIHVGLMTGVVENTNYNEDLWLEINSTMDELKSGFTMESIREIPAIKMGKNAYRHLGKDPNRYRISAEALLRRIAKGNKLYQIHTLVDILNLVSIKTGITIGGFDADKIVGDVALGIGAENEEFEAIGRGDLNIHRLPVYRDKVRAIGSPTSDCVATMMLPETVNFLMIVTGFYGPDGINECLTQLRTLMEMHIFGRDFDTTLAK